MIRTRALESDLDLNPGIGYWAWTLIENYFIPQLPYLKKGDNSLWVLWN